MHRSLLALVVVLATACCMSPDDVLIDFNSTSTSSLPGGGTQFGATIDGDMWWWNVSWLDVKDTPDWVPGDDPAISMPKAIQLARAEMTRHTETPEAYQLDGVQWSPITECCSASDARKWIYVVSFERVERFESGARGTMTIPVLLDGRVVAGVKAKIPR